ncbi:hypothetical protein C0Q70_16483 [Pomacea canaliculata]|uniref:C2H2-type domain-containing protein n=1 Tax=Pomacea canaliculata TaxID=400727 RepID=A0A2T7NPX2_POMCA|nr:hypothetical protein C0Q70_16483 [Pomacea canaliculata]
MIAMESMKSSRRKQTKPIRVPFGVDPDTGALDATINSQATPLPPSPHHTSEEDPRQNGRDGQEGMLMEEDADVPLDMHVSIIACKMCPETFPCSDDLREHMDLSHGAALKKPRLHESDFRLPITG